MLPPDVNKCGRENISYFYHFSINNFKHSPQSNFHSQKQFPHFLRFSYGQQSNSFPIWATKENRRRKASTVSARIAKWRVDELGLSMGEIARHVGMIKSRIAKALARLEEEGGL
jgi:hypothetical protein